MTGQGPERYLDQAQRGERRDAEEGDQRVGTVDAASRNTDSSGKDNRACPTENGDQNPLARRSHRLLRSVGNSEQREGSVDDEISEKQVKLSGSEIGHPER